MRYRFYLRALLVTVLVVLFLPFPCPAAPKADLWERWLAHDPQSTLSVDHASWDGFLKKYVVPDNDGINRVAYGKVSEEDRRSLDSYIDHLTGTPVSRLSRGEQLPLWINLYNALTVRVILTHYPVKSIQDIRISAGFFSRGPWDKKLIQIEGEHLSLNDIEHRILRPIWKDPRVHYGVNCASIGCPNLQIQAFTRDNRESLLEKAAREYINHPRGVRLGKKGLVVSSIYAWFAKDFGGKDAAIIDHLKRYAAPELQTRLRRFSRIKDDHYDWTLNDARPAKSN